MDQILIYIVGGVALLIGIVAGKFIFAKSTKQNGQDKVASYLVGSGFNEIFTNSITNAAYFSEEELAGSVKLLNNLSAEHNLMRPSMLQTGLESIAYNLNRKNQDLRFFEFGKTYHTKGAGNYEEHEHLCLYVTGQLSEDSWKGKGNPADLYYLKGVVARILQVTGVDQPAWQTAGNSKLDNALEVVAGKKPIVKLGSVAAKELKRFDVKQPVYYAEFDWQLIVSLVSKESLKVAELPKQLPVRRDLAMIVPKTLPFADVESTVKKVKLDKLQGIQLFDIF